jgi:tetratricopeptide (TPR) repeat protein
MSTYDPRTLIKIFTVLREEIHRFTQTSSDILEQAEYTQVCAQERVTQALRWGAIADNQVKSDLEDVQEMEVEVGSILFQCNTAVDTAHETISAVEQAQHKSEITLEKWEAELLLALAWQSRAEERLERAIQAFQQAERNFQSAKRDLERAESSLERCTNDSERKDCDSEQRAYNNARKEVAQAIEALEIAEAEVSAAQADLEKAKARVRCCRSAVGYAEQAVQHAHSAMEQAAQALNDAERSLENAESASRAANNAQAKALEAEGQIEQLLIKVHQAERITNNAQVHTQTARNMSDSAYRLAVMGNQELERRADQLIRLNQTSSGFWGGVEKGVAVVQIFGGLFGNVMSGSVPDISRVGLQSGEDIIAEAGVRASPANEENIRRRKEEAENLARAENEPKTSAPPDP